MPHPASRTGLRLGGGLALASPMGIFHVPNISPDPVDGIGAWRTVDLANALMSGVSPDRRHYYPALPYTSYSHMRPEDVRDLMAYLRTLAPVHGRPPPHELPFPFNIRRGVGLWKLLFFEPGPITADAAHDDAWNRGRYLVEALGHCAECHSTHNALGAVEPSTRFAGGPDIGGVGFVPNITPQRIGHWSMRDIAEMLRTGTNARPSHRGRLDGRRGAEHGGAVAGRPRCNRGLYQVIARAAHAAGRAVVINGHRDRRRCRRPRRARSRWPASQCAATASAGR